MAISKVNPVAGGKTRYVTTLTSGTSWTVPAGVTYVNVTLTGGGGGAGGAGYALATVTNGGTGGTTTFTGATSAAGGTGGWRYASEGYSAGTAVNLPGATGTANSGLGGLLGSRVIGNAAQAISGSGMPGTAITSTLSTTPGASITYAIGAGGTAGAGPNTLEGYSGGAGGSGKIDIEYWV